MTKQEANTLKLSLRANRLSLQVLYLLRDPHVWNEEIAKAVNRAIESCCDALNEAAR
jgi:hypothetical protein